MYQLLRTIEVRKSEIHGRGLFATQSIPKGTVVWQSDDDDDDHKDMSVIQFMGLEELYERTWANLWNHSCNPNCLFQKNKGKIVAVIDINAGEELTYHYDLTNFSLDQFECACGRTECKGQLYYHPNFFS